MSNSDELIEQLEGYVGFLASLREVDGVMWADFISDGKWSVRDIISHIMMWDKNFLDEIVPKLIYQEPVTLEEDSDVEGFNHQAVEYGKTLIQGQLLDEAIFYRSEIVSRLRALPDPTFQTVFPGRDSFTLANFLADLFVGHDAHHKEQIQRFLSAEEERFLVEKIGEKI